MKKILAVVLLCTFACVFVCSCAKNPEVSSSTAAEGKKNSSNITTSSETMSETQSEKPKESSSQKQNPSKKPTPSEAVSNNAESSTQSSSVKVSASDRMDVVMCAFGTGCCLAYGTDIDSQYQEIEDVVNEGYVNALSIGVSDMLDDRLWKIAEKYDLSMWVSAWAVFDSEKKTLEQYLSDIEKGVAHIKENADWYKRFKGFWYDEKIWRGETSADFRAETKAVYQKYGKRTYAVLATGEFSSIEGNDIGVSADDMNKVTTETFEFITDVAFDSYGIDVRQGAPNGNLKAKYEDIMPGIVDGPSYYREYTKRLLDIVGHPVNLWYLPCAFETNLAGGLGGIRVADEEYCLAHLSFFHDELEKREYAGGLMLYCYGSFSTEVPKKKGLQWFLIVEGEGIDEVVYKLRPNSFPKWREYSKRLTKIVEEYNFKKANVVTKL